MRRACTVPSGIVARPACSTIEVSTTTECPSLRGSDIPRASLRITRHGLVSWVCTAEAQRDCVEQGRRCAGHGDGTILQSSMFVSLSCPLPWAGHSMVPPSLRRESGQANGAKRMSWRPYSPQGLESDHRGSLTTVFSLSPLSPPSATDGTRAGPPVGVTRELGVVRG
jgi:hypothetical protein